MFKTCSGECKSGVCWRQQQCVDVGIGIGNVCCTSDLCEAVAHNDVFGGRKGWERDYCAAALKCECPKGSYCPNELAVPEPCPLGTYCPGSGEKKTCDRGTHNPRIASDTKADCEACPFPKRCLSGGQCFDGYGGAMCSSTMSSSFRLLAGTLFTRLLIVFLARAQSTRGRLKSLVLILLLVDTQSSASSQTKRELWCPSSASCCSC